MAKQPPKEQVVQIQLMQMQVVIDSTKRPVMLAVPPDISDAEVLELASWVAAPTGLRAMLPPPSPIIAIHGRLT